MMTNPIPILHKEFDIGLTQLMAAVKIPHIKRDTVRSMVGRHRIPEHLHKRFFLPTMTVWGQAVNDRHRAAQQLWACYFPDHEPHVYHLLSFVFYMSDAKLCKEAGISQRTLHKILRRPKLSKKQLRDIAPFAMRYRDALASKKQRGGSDPRYMKLHRALTDTKRIYEHGEIIAD